MMQDWANWSIETALRRGATYADVRVMDIRQRDLSTKNGEVGTLVEGETLGIGVRVTSTPTAETVSSALQVALAPDMRSRATAVAGTIRTDGAAVAARMVSDGRAGIPHRSC